MGDLILIAAWVLAFAWPALVAFVIWRGVVRGRGPNALSWGVIGVISTAWFLGVWAFLWEPQQLVVRRVEVVSPMWRGPPVRIGVISDTHGGGPHGDTGRLRRIVAQLNAEHPDVTVLLGDYVSGHVKREDRSEGDAQRQLNGLRPLGGLVAPLGVYAVLGNHDWWFDGPAVAAGLTAEKIRVLENQAARIERPDGVFWIGGLSDYDSEASLPSFIDTLASVPEGEPVFVLSHWPDAFAVAPDRMALMLSGHSHCGQVNLPFLGRLLHASEGAQRWPCGLYETRGRRLYVSSGTGVSIVPVRFRQPPEIAVITLRRE